MTDYYLGCSGFYNSSWKERFYPPKLPQRQWLEYYAGQFNSLEINSTFYRAPQKSTWQKWYDQVPADFRFAVKAPRGITHYKKFIECKTQVNEFYQAASDGLQEKLGPVLFQLPANFKYSLENLDRILQALDRTYLNVIEFRDPGWWSEIVYEQLAANNIVFCSISHPNLTDSLIVSGSTAYIRFHGVPNLYLSAYGNEYLERWAGNIRSANLETCYIYFNNTITADAIENANQLVAMLRS